MILSKIKMPQKIIVFGLLALLIAPPLLHIVVTTEPASAQTIDELQDRSQQLQQEIDVNSDKILELSQQVDTLQVKVDQLALEIQLATQEIELTAIKLGELESKLAAAEAELERQRDLLRLALRELYKSSNATTLELLITSDSFSDFISSQEYLDRLQIAVKTSVEQVVELKQQIEFERLEQERLLNKQEQQRSVVAAKKQEEQSLLNQTQGQEDAYRELVANQHAELEAAEDQLADLLAAGNFVSFGPVKKGDQIGQVGSTGYSTGPHIHFQVYKDGVTQNPHAGGTSIVNGWGWPTPGNFVVTTQYGWIHCSVYTGCANGGDYTVWHSGLDIGASAFDPIVSVADGDIIFKGCKGGLGYVVVVDHGGGWQSWYPHQVTPGGQIYGYC